MLDVRHVAPGGGGRLLGGAAAFASVHVRRAPVPLVVGWSDCLEFHVDSRHGRVFITDFDWCSASLVVYLCKVLTDVLYFWSVSPSTGNLQVTRHPGYRFIFRSCVLCYCARYEALIFDSGRSRGLPIFDMPTMRRKNSGLTGNRVQAYS